MMGDSEEARRPSRIINFLSRWLGYVDDVVLSLVAIGIIVLAVIMLVEAYSDFYFYSSHTIPHIVSDLMFVLILMELLRQVMRQLKRHSFSLNPFLFIGVIASIRGILIIQMKLALGLTEGWFTLVQIGIYSVIVFIMVLGYYFSAKIDQKTSD